MYLSLRAVPFGLVKCGGTGNLTLLGLKGEKLTNVIDDYSIYQTRQGGLLAPDLGGG